MQQQRPGTAFQQTRSAVKSRWHSIVSSRSRVHVAARASSKPVDDACDVSDPTCKLSDPEAKFRRYGKHFGGGYKLTADWLNDVPRVRVRSSAQRQKEELVELAVLNERLAGNAEPWQARQKLEFIKMRRKNWEQVYTYVTKTDAAATLALIEEASEKVEELLSEESRESKSVTELNDQLVALRNEVDNAKQRLHLTQSRVEQNLKRVNELKAEAAALERMRNRTKGTTITAAVATAEPSTAISSPRAPTTTVGNGSIMRDAREPSRAQRRGLQSGLEAEDALRNYWYPAEFTAKLTKDTLVPFDLFGEPWVLFRDANGQAACIKDECAHRACPLSLGKVIDGKVSCAYHGWEFDTDGACTKMPSTVHCRGVGVAALPTVEKHGFIWVWPGDAAPTDVPDYTQPPAGYQIHAELMMEVPVEHGLLLENLLDLAHAPFTHTSTFAKGWSVPDAVKFHATKMLSGYWDPYPIKMTFNPPCVSVSCIGLQQPGKVAGGSTPEQCKTHLWQLHACLPAKKGHTRLLYRMAMDFMPWVKYVPWIDKVWQNVAAQVLGEDLVLVVGQQDRMQRGGDTWANPVAYDKLGVRYRRWRNSVAQGAVASAPVTMSSGELFAIEEEPGTDMDVSVN